MSISKHLRGILHLWASLWIVQLVSPLSIDISALDLNAGASTTYTLTFNIVAADFDKFTDMFILTFPSPYALTGPSFTCQFSSPALYTSAISSCVSISSTTLKVSLSTPIPSATTLTLVMTIQSITNTRFETISTPLIIYPVLLPHSIEERYRPIRISHIYKRRCEHS